MHMAYEGLIVRTLKSMGANVLGIDTNKVIVTDIAKAVIDYSRFPTVVLTNNIDFVLKFSNSSDLYSSSPNW